MLPSISFTLDFIEQAHKNQKRKYTNDRYTIHCLNVANIVSGVSDNQILIHSALLHDTIEDTFVTYGEISRTFNQEVARIVRGLTNFDCINLNKRIDSRKERLKYYNEKLSRGCKKIHTIKLADIIDNLSDIEKHDPKFAKKYFGEKKQQFSLLTKGDKTLYNRCKQIIDNYYKGE